jgi:hypothetical protein
MKRDKAITKALERKHPPTLPAGFGTRMMEKIYAAEAKKKKKVYLFNIGLLSITSLALIAMAVYLLRDYLSGITFHMPSFHLTQVSVSQYGFCFYIAFLMLGLILTDHYIRHFIQKKKAKH